jgi:hypothetical protein
MPVIPFISTLVNRIEGLEIEQLDTCTSTGRVTEGSDNGGINSVLGFKYGRHMLRSG